MSFAPSSSSVAAKLGLEPDARLLLLGAPLPDVGFGAAIRVEHDADVVLLGCADTGDVVDLLATAWRGRRSGGRLWLGYRRGGRSFTRADLGAAVEGGGLGLTWFRQIALDPGWSAIWFKHRSEFRSLNH